jgi:mannitol-specific phosphotransferase system IIBC component
MVFDKLVPVICVAAPILSWIIFKYSPVLFNGYQIGFELLVINGTLTFLGLWAISTRDMKINVNLKTVTPSFPLK